MYVLFAGCTCVMEARWVRVGLARLALLAHPAPRHLEADPGGLSSDRSTHAGHHVRSPHVANIGACPRLDIRGSDGDAVSSFSNSIVAWSPNGDWVATAAPDKKVMVRGSQDYKVVQSIALEDDPFNVMWTSNDMLAAMDIKGSVTLAKVTAGTSSGATTDLSRHVSSRFQDSP